MRDCYVGDIGDFANNGLLRVMCGKPAEPVPNMRLGVVWYRNPGQDERGNETGYLTPSGHNRRTFADCDPDLHRELQRIVGRHMLGNTDRQIEDIIDSTVILRGDTQHYKTPMPRTRERETREGWFHNAMEKTGDSDVIFLNPDTGIDWQGRAQPTHVDPNEINTLLERGKIVIIYQHERRFDPNWIVDTARDLRRDTLAVRHLWVCRWGRESVRAYFIAAQTPEQRVRVQQRLAILQKSLWVRNGHITLPRI